METEPSRVSLSLSLSLSLPPFPFPFLSRRGSNPSPTFSRFSFSLPLLHTSSHTHTHTHTHTYTRAHTQVRTACPSLGRPLGYSLCFIFITFQRRERCFWHDSTFLLSVARIFFWHCYRGWLVFSTFLTMRGCHCRQSCKCCSFSGLAWWLGSLPFPRRLQTSTVVNIGQNCRKSRNQREIRIYMNRQKFCEFKYLSFHYTPENVQYKLQKR